MESNLVELVCREVVELVTEYLGGTLAAADRARFDQHLSSCPPCTAYLAQVRTTLSLAAEVGSTAEPTDGDVARKLGEMFRNWHDRRKS
ncbi:MAG TPA: zf-HC2 domain-containing protein [Polyangia bacterium]|nr:zf-HC2 domain-containing protein [Polyangia bacterium]